MKFKIAFLSFLFLNLNYAFAQLNETAKKEPKNESKNNGLEMVIIITKHAEKGVEVSYPGDPYSNDDKFWPNGLDHLTNKGKEDSFLLGRKLKSRYGQYFKSQSDIFAVLDESPYSNETVNTVLKSMFGNSQIRASHPDDNHKYALSGPETCGVLNRRFRRTLRSSEVKQLFKDNKELIQNITGSKGNDQKMVKNVPAIYESIQTELNNYLQQPDWLDDKAISKLNNITTTLDKLFYTNDLILQLESGKFLEEMRLHFIDSKLKKPSQYLKEMKFGYMYILGSDQFSAILNLFKIYSGRPKFASTIVIELDKNFNVRLNFYDSKTGKLDEKAFKCGQELVKQCELIPFLQTIDRLIPISLDKSCVLPKPRTIQPNYDEIFKKPTETDPDDHDCDNDLDDHEDEKDKNGDKRKRPNRREKRKESRRDKIKKYIEKKFKDEADKNKELIKWLTDLFEGFQSRLKSSIQERKLIKEQQKQNLTKLIESMREEMSKNRSKERTKRLDSIKKQFDERAEEGKVQLFEKLEELEFKIQDLLEDKFDQIETESNEHALKTILDNTETRFTDQMEENKSELGLDLNKLKDRLKKLLEDNANDDSNESDSNIDTRAKELENFISKLEEKEKRNELKYENQSYLILNNIIDQLKQVQSIEPIVSSLNQGNDSKDKLNETTPLPLSLVDEMEEANRNAANREFNITKFKSNLNMKNNSSEPTKLLRAANPIAEAPAFSPKGMLLIKFKD